MPSRARIIQLIGAAIIAGVVLHYAYYSLSPSSGSSPYNKLKDLNAGSPSLLPCKPSRPLGEPKPRPELERPQEGGKDRLEYLREMVSKTKGYYVRCSLP